MQTKEEYYDRRGNERRHDRSADSAFEISLPDQNRRHSDRRCNPRRRHERRNLSFQISIPDQVGKTINVSERGVCFEVITSDINAFSLGATIPIEINAATSTSGLKERDVRLKGKGSVVRNDIKNVTRRGNRLRVALELTENLILY